MYIYGVPGTYAIPILISEYANLQVRIVLGYLEFCAHGISLRNLEVDVKHIHTHVYTLALSYTHTYCCKCVCVCLPGMPGALSDCGPCPAPPAPNCRPGNIFFSHVFASLYAFCFAHRLPALYVFPPPAC
jgi:hypothetical protein